MKRLASVRTQLREFGIRDASDYAEALIAEVVDGQRLASRITKGHDVISEGYGRIEIKCRQLPVDGRLEERVEVSAGKEGGFDHLAMVIFYPDFDVKGAVIVPYAAVWEFTTRQLYSRISYSQARVLPGAIDISAAVREVSER